VKTDQIAAIWTIQH